MIQQLTKTYFCGVCRWTIGPGIDLSGDYYTTDFPMRSPSGIQVKGIPANKCALCYSMGVINGLDVQDDKAKMSTHTTLEADDIDALTEIELDEYGNRVLVDTKEIKQTLGIIDGKPAVIETPIMKPKMRELTKEEKNQKLEDAKIAIDELSKKG